MQIFTANVYFTSIHILSGGSACDSLFKSNRPSHVENNVHGSTVYLSPLSLIDNLCQLVAMNTQSGVDLLRDTSLFRSVLARTSSCFSLAWKEIVKPL